MNSTSAVVISLGLRDVLLNEKAQQIGSLSEQISTNDQAIRDEVEGHVSRMAKLNEYGHALRGAYAALGQQWEALQTCQAVTFAPETPAPVNPLVLQPPPAPLAQIQGLTHIPELAAPQAKTMQLMPFPGPTLPDQKPMISMTDAAGLPAGAEVVSTFKGKPIAEMSNEDIARASRNAMIEAAQREPHVKAVVEATFYDKGEPRPNGGSTRGEDEVLMEEMRAESAAGLLTPTPASASNDAEVAPSPDAA